MCDERARFLAQGDAGLEVAGAPLNDGESRANRCGADTVSVSCVLAPKRLASEVHRAAILPSEVERLECPEKEVHIDDAGRPIVRRHNVPQLDRTLVLVTRIRVGVRGPAACAAAIDVPSASACICALT